ncbi:hypothetical protein R4Z10_19415 [Niallia sp. XMNu-256]|uniref:hypothetical protein n=1 Tax=Niallia sp. XMNu-256 TaxID=3082444 RepID=UPI0030D01585
MTENNKLNRNGYTIREGNATKQIGKNATNHGEAVEGAGGAIVGPLGAVENYITGDALGNQVGERTDSHNNAGTSNRNRQQ